MIIKPDQVFSIQAKIATIKRNAEDRHIITDECDNISAILKDVIQDATLGR